MVVESMDTLGHVGWGKSRLEKGLGINIHCLFVDRFYIALFSALEQIHCTCIHVILHK